MLAATSEKFGNLEPVRILFSLVRTNPAQVPPTLVAHALAIIRQANALLARPDAIDQHTLPEAISLALAMRTHDELAQDLGPIDSLEQIDPAVAARALEHLDAAFAD
jgi:hypothetical protein